MDWLEISIHTTNEAIEPITNILNEIGTGGVVIENSLDLSKEHRSPFGEIYELNPQDYPKEGAIIKTYLADDEKHPEIVEDIGQSIDALRQYNIDVGENKLTIKKVDEEEWSTAWQAYYKPVQVSDRITIVPTWELYKPTSESELIIELDPGMAFGTGTHATTKLSLLALEKYMGKEDLVIDVGCGSGVLSIASIKLGAKHVYAYDLDNVAVKSTSLNAQLNQTNDATTVKQNDLLKNIHLKANVIVSNILAEVIVRFVEEAWNNLTDEGLFITSGIIKKKEEMVKQELVSQGFTMIDRQELDGWISLVAKKKVKG